MLHSVLTSFNNNPSLRIAVDTVKRNQCVSLHGLGGSSLSFLATAIYYELNITHKKPVLVVLPTEEEAGIFRDDTESIAGSEHIRYFPERDTSLYEHIDSHVEVRSQRMETLDALEHDRAGIVAVSAGALHDPTTPPGCVSLVSYSVTKGARLQYDGFIRSLVTNGFKRVNTVSEAGHMAVRGGIVDVFPFGGEFPFRTEFWGDEIESIRTFSTASQRSVDEVDGFRIIPPDEFITEIGLGAPEQDRIRNAERKTGINLDRIRHAFESGDRPNGIEQFLYLVFGSDASLERYFTENSCVIMCDPDRCKNELEKRFESMKTLWERQSREDHDLIPPELLYEKPSVLMDNIKQKPLIETYSLRPPKKTVVDCNVLSSRQYNGNIDEVKKDIQLSRSRGLQCHIACDNKGQTDRLDELLDDMAGEYSIEVARISGGFTDESAGIMLLTDHEIFSRYKRRVRYRRFSEGMPIPDFRVLRLGDFVVHVDYGIGKYMGLKRIDVGDAETDCLLIRYRGDDQLFLPVEQLKKLKKYTSEEGVEPVVNKLGGTAWDKLKERTKKSIEHMAKDLLKLYAERKAFPGHAFQSDETILQAFVDSFVFEDTPDQRRAWEEISADLKSLSPMDRLLCGDVGFGKTEVALRAAFMAVLDNMQVLMLVPTTILADQHEETFNERLADFPATVESLSRFRTKKEQMSVIDRMAAGKVDIVIGTHRLLSKDVRVKNLGLLIIDEEQRFGVKHKERIKKLRRSVDVLSMSATPIPRTLNMSMSGARDISFITTPPPDRYSVHTQIVPFEEQFIVEAIMKEVDRGGQVYFVHNRVRSIDGMATYLRSLLPNVSFCIAHGQLPERELERIMREFHHEKYQVLISTMIIENGLDIPNVNTIIINRADTFGLAQLYQLRGRVGRSNKRANAYLLVPPKVPLSNIARQRLRIIEEFAELGSGFKIAMRDLEIRGAGNILGTDQTGFIAAIGFDLYTDLLRETIAGLKGEKISKPPEIELTIKADMFIPENYVPDSQERVALYRRLSETVSADEVRILEEELTDRFGRPDEPARNLIDSAFIRHYAAMISVTDVFVKDTTVRLFVPEGIELTRDWVEEMVKKSPVKLEFSFEAPGMTVSFSIPDDSENIVSAVKKVLQAIA
ncbi:transcription-repair coupling factor [Candidatus Latescibacterota bacterium]